MDIRSFELSPYTRPFDTSPLSTKHSNAFVEPITAEVIIAVVSAVASYLRDQDLKQHYNEINEKLDSVIALCVLITEQLKALELLLPAALEDQYRNVLIKHLQRHNMNFRDNSADIIGHGGLNNDIAFRIEQEFRALKDTTYDLMVCGYTVYPAVASGASLLFAIAVLMKPTKMFGLEYIQSVYMHIRSYFTAATNASVQDSITSGKARKVTEEAQYWERFTHVPRQGFMGGSDIVDYGWQCYYLTFTGSPPEEDNARLNFRFGGSIMQDSGGWNRHGWFDYHSLVPNVNQDISHMDGARDVANIILAAVNSIAVLRDGAYSKKIGLQSAEGTIVGSIIPKIDEMWALYKA